MSPAIFVFLPLTLLLLMSKGAGTHSKTPTSSKTTSGKVMGILTENGDFIPLPSLTEDGEMAADDNGVVIRQNGHRYLLATVKQ